MGRFARIAGVLLLLTACDDDAPPSAPTPFLSIQFAEPVEAMFVDETEVFVAEFPVTLSIPGGETLESIESLVFNESRGSVLARNVRPNAEFVLPDRGIPPEGALDVEAGVGFAPPPPRDLLTVRVIARLTSGEVAERRDSLVMIFP